MDYFVFIRPGQSEIDLPSNLFLWEGPDGSQVLTARVECYNSLASAGRQSRLRSREVWKWIGLYGGGPTKKAIQSIRDVNANPDWPTLKFDTLEHFFDRAAGREHPVVSYELQHHARGCYSAYSLIKTQNRRGEESLLMAEKYTHAWRQLLFNQFHDILAGSSIASAYADSNNEMGGALQTIAQRIDTRRDNRVIEEPIRRVRFTGRRP